MDNEEILNDAHLLEGQGSLYKWEIAHYNFVKSLDAKEIEELLKSNPNSEVTFASKDKLNIAFSTKAEEVENELPQKFLLVIHDEPTIQGINEQLTI